MAHFGSNVSGNSAKKMSESDGLGYIRLPKNLGFFNPPMDAKVTLDILPYIVTDEQHIDRDKDTGSAMVGEQWYKRPYFAHRGIGPFNETVVCPSTFGMKCPICEYRKELLSRAKTDEKAAEEAKALKPTLRNLYLVLPIGLKDHEERPYLWDISQYIFQKQLDPEILEDESRAIFPDLEQGLSLRIRIEKANFQGRDYADIGRIDFIERDQQYDPEYINDLPNLDEMLIVLPYKELQAKFLMVPEDDVEEGNAPAPRRRGKSAEKEEGVELSQVTSARGRIREDENSAPAAQQTRRTRGSAAEEKAADKCPNGYKFGTDCNLRDECDNDCDVWEQCMTAQKEERARRKR